MQHQQEAEKKLKSFALFPAKKKQKYQSAYELFAKAAAQYMVENNPSSAADCLVQQARISINKLSSPVQSATHYMEACRAYMLTDEHDKAFECLQLAVQARQKPHLKHAKKMQGGKHWQQMMELTDPSNITDDTPAPLYSRLVLATDGGSDGRSLLVMEKKDNNNKGKPPKIKPPKDSASSSALKTTSPNSDSDGPSPPRLLNRRHSMSTLHANNLFPGVDEEEVLHLDLLLARLATQLATDLWADLDYKDAVIALEMSSSLFATLLSAESNGARISRSHSLSSTPTNRTPTLQGNSAPGTPNILPITGLIRPLSEKPLPSFFQRDLENNNKSQPTTPCHSHHPSLQHQPASEGNPPLSLTGELPTLILPSAVISPPEEESSVTVLEESLVCRYQLAHYYVQWDEELSDHRSIENHELRRAKALYEGIARAKPDIALVHSTLLQCIPQLLTENNIDVASIIADYTADDDKLIYILFLAGLCDALLTIRTDKFISARVVECPQILHKYRELSLAFAASAEIRLLRQIYGLQHLASSLSARIRDVFGVQPVAKQIVQAAWGAELLNEFTTVISLFTKTRPLSNIAAKLLMQIKTQMKVHIAR